MTENIFQPAAPDSDSEHKSNVSTDGLWEGLTLSLGESINAHTFWFDKSGIPSVGFLG
jgi:hypothetical protein